MSIGEMATDPRLTFYTAPRTWPAAAMRALGIRTDEAEGGARWDGHEIDAYVADDRSQWWEQRWLSSYRTVLVQRAQTLQRELNNLYSRQLAGTLFSSIDRDPNYSMANLQRMGRDPGGAEVGPSEGTSGADASLFSMSQAFAGGTKPRQDQDPISYEWAVPPQAPPPGGFLTGPDWTSLEQHDFGDWISRQYRQPEMPFQFPNPLDYLHWHSAEDIGAPNTGQIELGLGYFDVAGFVSALAAPLFYPMFFQRMETFAHSEADSAVMDAATIRSDYLFRMKAISDFPGLGPLLGGAIGAMAGLLGNVPMPYVDPLHPEGLVQWMAPAGPDATAQALDLLLHPQPWISAPRKVETEPGAFFATTLALQDWGMQDMDYRYFSAARYQQEAIDTDMLAAFRKSSASAMKLIINTVLLAAPPIKILTSLPLASTIFDAILNYATDNLTNMILRPIRDQIELDTQYETAGHPVVDADGSNVYHVGDPPGLFGLSAAWEPGGFAAGYALNRDATNRTEINQVEILTKRHTLTDLWDGQGLATQHALERQVFDGVSSRLVNVGMQPQQPLDLSEFRIDTNSSRTTMSGYGHYSRREDSYALSGTSLLGSRIQVGTDVLNPGFGGGVLMTDLDTLRLDTFFNGSISQAPMQGDFADVFDPGAPPAGQPDAPVFDPAGRLTAATAGTATFVPGADGIARYVFAPVPAGPDGLPGLRVTYWGQDTLMADLTTPQHIADARDPDHYRVTDRNGQPITATVITGEAPVAVSAVLPGDWAGPADPLVTAPMKPGIVDLDLGSRIAAAPQDILTPGRDTDSGHLNATRLVFLPPDATARLRQNPPLFGSEGDPATGGEFQVAGVPATDFGNLAAPGNAWIDWRFVAKAGGDDYNRDGSIQAGSLAANGDQSVVEAPSAIKEAVHNWSDLVQRYVPSAFRMATPILTGNDATGRPFALETWNTAYRPDAHVLKDNPDGSPYYVSNTPMGYSAASPPPATAVNPYFWSGSDGYQYITIWDGAVTTVPNPQTDADRQRNGLPDPAGTPPAHIRAVLRIRNGTDKVEVLGDGTAVLLHRENQLATIPADKADAVMADLLARGFTQGRGDRDTTLPRLYDLAHNPQPAPPAGTPGDFVIVGGGAGSSLQVAFTRPYDGLVTVPPNRDGAGNPLDAWWTVNGWCLSAYDDANPAQSWAGSPAGKLQASTSNPGYVWGATIPGGQDGTNGQQISDRITVAKTLALTAPTGTTSPLTGQILPGEPVAVNVVGANTGLATTSYEKLPQVHGGPNQTYTVDNAVTLEPDRFVVRLTNGHGTVTIPATKPDTATGGLRPETAAEAVGMATVIIPSDLMTSGDNTVSVEVRKGGIYQRFCRSEPPADQTDPTSQMAAGFWVSTDPVVDRDGTTWPAGNLFFENRMVGDGSGRYVVLAGSDVVLYNDNPLGPGVGGLDTWRPVDVNTVGWKPDSYDATRRFDTILYPFLLGTSGGYQRKADIRAGVSVTTDPLRQTIHTYAQETVDRYRYMPATQTVADVLPPVPEANHLGPLWTGGPIGHLSPPPIVPPSGGQRNEAFVAGAYVADAPVTSGQNAVGHATIGRKIDRTNRQVFGSDDNLLVRHLYAAMKGIDLDGAMEDDNGNGVLDAGEDRNRDGVLQQGLLAADERLYREYRDAFNMGYLDHLTIVGSANFVTGGAITSTVEVTWRPDGDGRIDNDYQQNYEYFANETDRANKRYTTRRRADLLMASYHAFKA
jgi:hypothetical protein